MDLQNGRFFYALWMTMNFPTTETIMKETLLCAAYTA